MPDKKESLYDTLTAYGTSNPITRAGQWWAQDNAEFDASNPNIAQRVIRSVNPMTAFGSAMGSMHDAASEGNKMAMALSLFGALPVFAAARPVQRPIEGLIAAGMATAPVRQTMAKVGANAASQTGIDAVTSRLLKGSQ